MRFDIISSLILAGSCSYFGLCELDDVRAEYGVQSSPSKIGQKTYSLDTRAAEFDSNLSPIAISVKPAVSEPKLLRRGKPWSDEEEQRLLKLRGEEQLPWAEIAELFPERSWRAIMAKYYKLTRDPFQNSKPLDLWTDEEKEILLDLKEDNLSWDEIAEHLPRRTAKAIKTKYKTLTEDFQAPKEVLKLYTAEEDELLVKLGKMGIPWKERATYFNNRTLRSLASRYSQIKPPGLGQLGAFTREEDKQLIEALELGMTDIEISQLLQRRVEGVRARIRKLEQLNQLDPAPQIAKGRPYTVADYDLMREKVDQGMSWKDITIQYFPGRSIGSIQQSYRRYLSREQREGE